MKYGGYYRTISTLDVGQGGVQSVVRITCKKDGTVYKATQFWFPAENWWITGYKWKTPHCPKCKFPFILPESKRKARKKILKIDLDGLCSAMEDSSAENNYYLNLETGEILLISDYMDDEEIKKLKGKIDENFDRYELLPKAELYESYEDMNAFISTVKDEHLVELLFSAINGKGAFRRFKDVLERYPEERGSWFHFKDDRLKERALEWLEDIGVSLFEE